MSAMPEMIEDDLLPTSPVSGRLLAVCKICGVSGHWIGDHIATEHQTTLDEYLAKYPGATIASQDVLEASQGMKPVAPRGLTVQFGRIEFPVHVNVPRDACLKMPEAYRIPKHGELAAEIEDAALALLEEGVSVYIYGRGGSGKDAFVQALSALARMPATKLQVRPGEDLQPWFYEKVLQGGNSFWGLGPVLRQMRDGYLAPDGTHLPYLILITDWDRATEIQAEFLRLVLDSIEGRVPGPQGESYPLFPGTRVIATGNTAGGGDSLGRYVSARVMDGTIVERWDASFEFPWMEWEDEVEVVKQKFPLFVKECSNVTVNGRKTNLLTEVGDVTTTLRQEISKDKLYTDFSHRHVCHWLKHAERRLRRFGFEEDILARSAKVWLTRIADNHTRMKTIKLMDAKISARMLGRDAQT